MSQTEVDSEDNKYWHRKQCSNRVFIGPWDIKAPLPPEQFETSEIESLRQMDSDSSLKLLNNPKNSLESPSSSGSGDKSLSELIVTPSSDGLSFITAKSEQTNSTTYDSASSTPQFNGGYINHHGNDEDEEEEEIDYDLLQNTPIQDNHQVENTKESDTESIQTIRPSPASKGKLPMNDNTTTNTASPSTTTSRKKSKKKVHRLTHHSKKPLLWKKAGAVFVSQMPRQHERQFIPTGKPIKREPILCMRSAAAYHGTEPSRYKAAKEARYDLLTEKWRQVELVLTSTYITTYSSSTMFWPKLRLEHRVYLDGPKKPKQLELFLLSPLDYTFCLRYTSHATKTPMAYTLTFKARSFLKCQEWYMQLYDILPSECKRPCPKWCEVYIPMMDLSVNLPLLKVKQSDDILIEDVKDAVIAVLEEEENDVETVNERMAKLKSSEELGLCWTTKDRAEWVYWKTSSSDPKKRIDWVVGPQSIERTHRLELRLIEHTPHDIILKENFVLKEPPPVEGFLTCITDFFGSNNGGPFSQQKMNYFASFDQYLFYIPTSKVSAPNMACFLEPENMPKNIRSRPYISAISPYTPTCTQETRFGEIHRRMRLMTDAKGVIDLTEVSYVRRSFSDDVDDDTDSRMQSGISKRSSQTPFMRPVAAPKKRRSSGFFRQVERRDKARLEIIMENGLQIRFEAYSKDTCDLWVNYLAQIIVYWKARKEAEKDVHTLENFSNINVSKPTPNTLIKDGKFANTQDGCVHNKEEAVADTRIWSYCFYEQCRDVVKSGVLYYKPHKRGSYSQKMFILTASGWILFYDIINRDTTKKNCNHNRKGAIDIAGCYFYSGVDSSKQKKGSNQENAFKKVARLYGNGLATDDDNLSCIFSIWKPKLRRYFSSKRQRLRVYRHDQRLNPNGQTWTFLARSRREKEEWVCALNTITEHMIRCENR